MAESRHDVQFAATKADVAVVMEAMRRHGVDDIMVSAHVEGDLLKFYGVHGTGFFRYFYPGDDGMSKFGDERLNGRPHHYILMSRHCGLPPSAPRGWPEWMFTEATALSGPTAVFA